MTSQSHSKRVTIADVAAEAAVTKSTVSLVLNERPKAQAFAPQTRERIFKAARKLNYKANATARALATRRTRNLGFILSDTVAGGWGNLSLARQLAGVEKQCRAHGYGLQISLYNLQNLDKFVFPQKVGQQAIDGLILNGYITSGVLARFAEFDLPCVCIGDNIEKQANITTISCDMVGSFYKVIEYVSPMGHKRIGYTCHGTRRDIEVCQQANQKYHQSGRISSCQMIPLIIPVELNELQRAQKMIDDWLQTPKSDRPTVIISYDQLCFELLMEMKKRGLNCPAELSLIATTGGDLCRYVQPALTTLEMNLAFHGSLAVDLLIDHLDHNKPLGIAQSHNNFSMELVVRQSCASLEGSECFLKNKSLV